MGTGVNIKLTRAMEILAGTPELAKYWRKEDSGTKAPRPAARGVEPLASSLSGFSSISARSVVPVVVDVCDRFSR